MAAAGAVVVGMAVGGEAVVGGHRRSWVGSSVVRWLLLIMPLLFRTIRRPMHRHRPMGRGGGVTPRNRITPTHRLAPAGSEPFSHGETRRNRDQNSRRQHFVITHRLFGRDNSVGVAR